MTADDPGIRESQVIDEIKMKYSNYLFNEIISVTQATVERGEDFAEPGERVELWVAKDCRAILSMILAVSHTGSGGRR